MKVILKYERIYFKNFENTRRRKVKSQSIDFDPTLIFKKIREEKGEIILQKLYFEKLKRQRRILIKRS